VHITALIFNAARSAGVKLTQRILFENALGPEVVIRLLRAAPDPLKTLSASFFDVALNPTAAQRFGLVQFWQTLHDSLVECLQIFLTLDGSPKILRALVMMRSHLTFAIRGDQLI
jgi:hypothetical protein